MIMEEYLYNEIEEITSTEYGGWLNEDKNEYLVTYDKMLSMIEDLIIEVEHYKKQYEDLKQDLKENYKPISISEQVE